MSQKYSPGRNILYVIASLRGGAAEHLVYLLEFFSQRGDKITLAAPDDCPGTATKLRDLPIHWKKIALDKRFSWSAVRTISRVLHSEKMDLLHTHGLRAGYYGRHALAKARRKGCAARSVYTVHGFHAAYYSSSLARWAALRCEKQLFDHLTDQVIFVSENDRTLFGNRICPDVSRLYERSSLIPNGIRYPVLSELPGRAEARATLSLAPDAFVIGTLSRLNRQKAVHLILEATALLSGKIPELMTLIAGDGPLQKDLERTAHRLGIAERVRFLGYRADPLTIYRALDCFVLSSLWEGLPLVLLEAAAVGLPMVASFVPGTDEILQPEKTGLFFARGEAKDLAEQVCRIHDEPAWARQLGQAAQATIPARFSLENMLEKTARVYDNLLRTL